VILTRRPLFLLDRGKNERPYGKEGSNGPEKE
jgi:hypothetical protein